MVKWVHLSSNTQRFSCSRSSCGWTGSPKSLVSFPPGFTQIGGWRVLVTALVLASRLSLVPCCLDFLLDLSWGAWFVFLFASHSFCPCHCSFCGCLWSCPGLLCGWAQGPHLPVKTTLSVWQSSSRVLRSQCVGLLIKLWTLCKGSPLEQRTTKEIGRTKGPRHQPLLFLGILCVLATSLLYLRICQQPVACHQSKEFSELGIWAAGQSCSWTGEHSQKTPWLQWTCPKASLWCCEGPTLESQKFSGARGISIVPLKALNCQESVTTSLLKPKSRLTLLEQDYVSPPPRRNGAARWRCSGRAWSGAITLRLWPSRFPALRAGSGFSWTWRGRCPRSFGFCRLSQTNRLLHCPSGAFNCGGAFAARSDGRSTGFPGTIPQGRSGFSSFGRRCHSAAATTPTRSGFTMHACGFHQRGSGAFGSNQFQRGATCSVALRFFGLCNHPRSRQSCLSGACLGTRRSRKCHGPDPVLFSRRSSRNAGRSSTEEIRKKKKSSRSWYHWRRLANSKAKANSGQPCREPGSSDSSSTGHHRLPPGLERPHCSDRSWPDEALRSNICTETTSWRISYAWLTYHLDQSSQLGEGHAPAEKYLCASKATSRVFLPGQCGRDGDGARGRAVSTCKGDACTDTSLDHPCESFGIQQQRSVPRLELFNLLFVNEGGGQSSSAPGRVGCPQGRFLYERDPVHGQKNAAFSPCGGRDVHFEKPWTDTDAVLEALRWVRQDEGHWIHHLASCTSLQSHDGGQQCSSPRCTQPSLCVPGADCNGSGKHAGGALSCFRWRKAHQLLCFRQGLCRCGPFPGLLRRQRTSTGSQQRFNTWRRWTWLLHVVQRWHLGRRGRTRIPQPRLPEKHKQQPQRRSKREKEPEENEGKRVQAPRIK